MRLEELEKQLECMKHGESGGTISFGDLVSGVGVVCACECSNDESSWSRLAESSSCSSN